MNSLPFVYDAIVGTLFFQCDIDTFFPDHAIAEDGEEIDSTLLRKIWNSPGFQRDFSKWYREKEIEGERENEI